jgi:hypothetical protein
VFSPPAGAQVVYLGDLCWNVTSTEDRNGPVNPTLLGTLRSGLTYVGGLHFSFQGTFTWIQEGDVGVVNGAGEVVGADLVISMAFYHDHRPDVPILENGALELRVNGQTGTWWAISSYFNRDTKAFDRNYGAGTVALVACP